MSDIEDLHEEADAALESREARMRRAAKVAIHRPKAGEDLEVAVSGGVVPGLAKIWVKSFGCQHNHSDGEYMKGLLQDYGYTLVKDSDADSASLWLINSCTVKNPSQDAMAMLISKAKTKGKKIVTAGCVPQAERTLKTIKGLSVVGVKMIDRVVEVVEETLKGHTIQLLSGSRKLPSLHLPKIRKDDHIEIIPISTGCLGRCTYCKTRYARGKLGSYPLEDIVKRVKDACADGVLEIWLTSEDTGAYGKDIGRTLPELMRAIVRVLEEQSQWVMLRIGMTNPPFILEHLQEFAELMNHPNVYSFAHIPVQSGSNKVLGSMQRDYVVEDFEELVAGLRNLVPDMTIHTDMICGFSTETEEDHRESLALIAKYRFTVVNISQYFPRPGTVAAKWPRLLGPDLKGRTKEMTELTKSYDRFSRFLGTIQRVWVCSKLGKHGETTGHTKGYIKVLLARDDSLIGKVVDVKVTEFGMHHVSGEVIAEVHRTPVARPPEPWLSRRSVLLAIGAVAVLAGALLRVLKR